MEYLEFAVDIAPMVIAIASGIAAITPTPKDNEALYWIKKVLGVLALNVGKAKPAEDVLAEQRRGVHRKR